jgi:hypothetical protein
LDGALLGSACLAQQDRTVNTTTKTAKVKAGHTVLLMPGLASSRSRRADFFLTYFDCSTKAKDRARFFRLICSDVKDRTDPSLLEDYASYSRHGGRGATAPAARP